MERRFAGKVAIVTGAGQGIGKGVALRLAREGATVVVADYNAHTASETSLAIQGAGGQALPYTVNIADVNIGPSHTGHYGVLGAIGYLAHQGWSGEGNTYFFLPVLRDQAQLGSQHQDNKGQRDVERHHAYFVGL